MTCQEKIELPGNKTTYCTLIKGHEGKHVAVDTPNRCQSFSDSGLLCGFPYGHSGLHGNGYHNKTW